jgi:hypothetical protein
MQITGVPATKASATVLAPAWQTMAPTPATNFTGLT